MRRSGSGVGANYPIDQESNDFDIQEVILMPYMRLDEPLPVAVQEAKAVAAPEPPKTTFVLQQLG